MIDNTSTEPILYSCVAPNYLKEIVDESGTSLDYIKEVCCSSFKDVYSKNQIKKMSNFGFDLWKGLVWVDHIKLKHDFSIIELGEKYRLHPAIMNIKKMIQHAKTHLKSRFDIYGFYSRKALLHTVCTDWNQSFVYSGVQQVFYFSSPLIGLLKSSNYKNCTE